MQTINYKGTEFQIKNNNLAIKKAGFDLLFKYRELQLKHLDILDTSIIDSYKKRMYEYETVIKQVSANQAVQGYYKDEKEKKKDFKYLKDIEKKLIDLKNEYENDNSIKVIKQAQSEIMGMIILRLTLEVESVKELFGAMLMGDLSVIDYESPEYSIFAMEALTYFFTIMELNKKT